ncbi:hypothetical protein DACRYDRAFT_23267 [Dacryopinax primogenitus]|uniref:Uncharacterized protein n=1 Tax=Dacryopinax primogenitus (strain DJM 731) TaxID=1858805 RepID=M5FVM2_DACPD|nr:uncharacterized protein DACRYDRAFT_23267 [Dacryopinax primogenitus]EJU00364.1 hypothetical protein DACRYDRAFT_23267 [Dacryopinax primogenitus]
MLSEATLMHPPLAKPVHRVLQPLRETQSLRARFMDLHELKKAADFSLTVSHKGSSGWAVPWLSNAIAQHAYVPHIAGQYVAEVYHVPSEQSRIHWSHHGRPAEVTSIAPGMDQEAQEGALTASPPPSPSGGCHTFTADDTTLLHEKDNDKDLPSISQATSPIPWSPSAAWQLQGAKTNAMKIDEIPEVLSKEQHTDILSYPVSSTRQKAPHVSQYLGTVDRQQSAQYMDTRQVTSSSPHHHLKQAFQRPASHGGAVELKSSLLGKRDVRPASVVSGTSYIKRRRGAWVNYFSKSV